MGQRRSNKPEELPDAPADPDVGELQVIIKKFSDIVECSPPLRRAELLPALRQLQLLKDQLEKRMAPPMQDAWLWNVWNNQALDIAMGAIEEDHAFKDSVRSMLRLSVKGAPSYVMAVLSTDAGEATGRKDRPYKWLWETQYFGTMLYNYLRGTKGKKRLVMRDVCGKWLERNGGPMNYNSIKAMRSELPDRLHDKLAQALDAAGFPYNPPAERVERAHAIRASRAK